MSLRALGILQLTWASSGLIYRASAKWAAFMGSCSFRRSIWFASATQLLAMLRMIASDAGDRLGTADCIRRPAVYISERLPLKALLSVPAYGDARPTTFGIFLV